MAKTKAASKKPIYRHIFIYKKASLISDLNIYIKLI